MGMKIIGVTGGIGAGKSSVSSLLKEKGAVVIDADLLARQAVEPGKPALKRIRDTFGETVLFEDGSLNRKQLAQIVFDSEQKRLELEAIIHKEVVEEMQRRLEGLRKSQFDGIAVLDVPIPVRHGFLDTVDRVLVVVCNEEERIQRVIRRGGISREEAVKRIRSQLSQDEYIKLADEVIPNDGSQQDLKDKVDGLYTQLVR